MAESDSSPRPHISPEGMVALQHREDVMKQLLGTDYEFAVENGLLDQFYFDPETGEDGLLHTLTGDVVEHSEKGILPGGFHHEPSAQDDLTYVDRDHLEHKSSRNTREFREWPYNPYAAHVVIGGFRKVRVKENSETGAREVHDANNSMFPKEYDALTVLQAVKLASENIDHSKDRDAGNLIITEGLAPRIDGGTMKVRLWIEKKTGKIASAFPPTSTGRKQFTRDEIREYLGLTSDN